ncbi:hypothetical protein lbkm_0657 [Lachnospiraceae bacterium KM106-2]|nr:hypothetical protein lbkm_0657 [Lachnospiraceae bacterium KM106-2]
MNRLKVNIEEIVKEMFPKALIKDLQEDERICPTCKGLGIVIVNNEYGIKGDKSQEARKSRFPYRHQSFTFCPTCYNGVQSVCKYCGEPIPIGWINKCSCSGYKNEQAEKERKKWNETLSKAVQVKEEDVENMLYCVETDDFYMDVDDFLEQWECNHYEDEEKPIRLWVTSKEEMSITASDVIENACDGLHDDAADNCDYKSLQKILDDWCKEQTGTTTYYPCYKEYVLI